MPKEYKDYKAFENDACQYASKAADKLSADCLKIKPYIEQLDELKTSREKLSPKQQKEQSAAEQQINAMFDRYNADLSKAADQIEDMTPPSDVEPKHAPKLKEAIVDDLADSFPPFKLPKWLKIDYTDSKITLPKKGKFAVKLAVKVDF